LLSTLVLFLCCASWARVNVGPPSLFLCVVLWIASPPGTKELKKPHQFAHQRPNKG
jgi:hypothetical protein